MLMNLTMCVYVFNGIDRIIEKLSKMIGNSVESTDVLNNFSYLFLFPIRRAIRLITQEVCKDRVQLRFENYNINLKHQQQQQKKSKLEIVKKFIEKNISIDGKRIQLKVGYSVWYLQLLIS